MSNYYSPDELKRLGIKYAGENVLISKKASIYNPDKMEFGNNVRIDDFCVLSGKIIFGSFIHITAFNLIAGADEGVFFDDFTTLAYRCLVFTRSDDYSGETLVNSMIPEKYRYNTIKQPVHIKKHVIIGANSVIFPGVDIEEGVSVGAMSLVLKPTEPWSIYAGIPAKRIKERKKDLLKQEELFLRGT